MDITTVSIPNPATVYPAFAESAIEIHADVIACMLTAAALIREAEPAIPNASSETVGSEAAVKLALAVGMLETASLALADAAR